MNKKLKLISTAFTALLFITACGSASSDAKKVEVKQPAKAVEKAEEIKMAEAKAPEEVAKKAPSAPKSNPEFVEGVHYARISPAMQTDVPEGKVEVIEMMWLGCPHCYTLEPIMLEYKKNHPPYVEFQQVPAMLNSSWAADASTYIIGEILDPKGEKELIMKVFQAIHDQKRRIRNPNAAKRFFVQLGFTEEEVDAAKASMLYRTKMKRAERVSESSQAQSVPVVLINGKYRTSPYMAGSEEKLMKIIDMLTRKEKK